MNSLFVMHYNLILVILELEIKYSQNMWPPSYKVDLEDKQSFVISLDENYDEDDKGIIQPEDLTGIASLVKNETKYDPLHSQVENYDRRTAEKTEKISQKFPFHPVIESTYEEDPKPFIAGFKQLLDKYDFEKPENSNSLKKKSSSEDVTFKNSFKNLFSAIPANINQGYVNNNYKKIKRDEEEDPLKSTDPSTDSFEGFSNGNSVTEEGVEEEISEFTELSTTEKIEKLDTTISDFVGYSEETTLSEDEGETHFHQTVENSTLETEKLQDYDYDKLKEEYDQQIEKLKRRNEIFNYTDQEEPEETIKDSVKKVVDFKKPKNCTKEELSQFGAKAFECLVYDYQHVKNKTDVKKAFNRAWLVIKIWVFIYLCIAIPCWCQKGWCFCCFCCEICSPKEIIEAEKKYFAENPPGIRVERIEVDGVLKSETDEYKPTLFEYEAYEEMESAIKNL